MQIKRKENSEKRKETKENEKKRRNRKETKRNEKYGSVQVTQMKYLISFIIWRPPDR